VKEREWRCAADERRHGSHEERDVEGSVNEEEWRAERDVVRGEGERVEMS